MDRRRVIIDCDPGVDDAVMLLLACAARDALDIAGITTVAGNVGAALTARNACIVREIAAREDIPVFAGCTRPLQRTPVEAGHFHGESGLGHLPITTPRHGAEPRHAVDFIVETLLAAAPSSVTLVATGPLTNLATALARDPAIRRGLREIAIMGGARSEGGNITASAEYNIHADPDAAQAVFGSGCTVVAFGLDATHQVRATPARVDAVRAVGSRAALAAADLLEFSNALPANGPREQGAPLHDPCPIAWLLRPEAFKFRPCHVDVETVSSLTLGHTAVEFRAAPQRPQNVLWAVAADGDAVFEVLTRSLVADARRQGGGLAVGVGADQAPLQHEGAKAEHEAEVMHVGHSGAGQHPGGQGGGDEGNHGGPGRPGGSRLTVARGGGVPMGRSALSRRGSRCRQWGGLS